MSETLTLGAFEALDQQEMLEVDGGFLDPVSIYASYLLGRAIYEGCKYLYNLGYENGYNSTRG